MRIDSTLYWVLFIGLCVLAGCERSANDTSSVIVKDGIIGVSPGDKEVNAAIEKARNSLNVFRDRFQNPQPTDSEFCIKVRIEDEHGTEHVWAKVIRIVGDGFVGNIKNQPWFVKNVNMGDEIKITKDNLSDWTYLDKGKTIGGFTVRALLKKIPKDRAEAMKKEIGWD